MADTNIFVVGLGIGLDEEGRGLLGLGRGWSRQVRHPVQRKNPNSFTVCLAVS